MLSIVSIANAVVFHYFPAILKTGTKKGQYDLGFMREESQMDCIRELKGNIYTSNGYCVKIDQADYGLVSKFKWRAVKRGSTLYAETKIERKTIVMHRLILGCKKGHEVDHVDGDGLNNTKENIRICTRFENQQNRGVFRNNKSGYCGVYFDSRKKKSWRAEINANNKRYFLGYFHTPREAAISYNNAATRLHGNFAKLNAL